MQSIVLALLLAAGPVEYMKIVTNSKLTYKIGRNPATVPAEDLTCGRHEPSKKVKLEALQLLNAGDALFDKEDYAGAAKKFEASIAADPAAPMGYFFLGDALLNSGEAEAALAQYRKGIALDLMLPSGHLFAQSALVELDRRDEAREEIVKALAADPRYEPVWKIADKPERWNAKPVVRHTFDVPSGYLGKRQGDSIELWGGPDNNFLFYATCKAVWANEPQFAKKHVANGWSIEEEHACVGAWLEGEYNKAGRKVDKLDPRARHLWDVSNSKLLDGYILFEIIGQHCPMAMATLDDASRGQLEQYIRKYVIVSAGQ
ncbi:MAG TPA: tetratricopeptide repeat protein [Thermoanaerobaculia bacterium]|nr:tetratricopeptide repeat protein [Thermoanaerobaculia bacterium]